MFIDTKYILLIFFVYFLLKRCSSIIAFPCASLITIDHMKTFQCFPLLFQDYEVRLYEKSEWVSTNLQDVEYKAATYNMFMKLFQYISGANVAS